MPWLIIAGGWPALVARVAGATSRLAVEPAIEGAVVIGALAGAGAILWRGRARRATGAEVHAPVAASSAPGAPPGS